MLGEVVMSEGERSQSRIVLMMVGLRMLPAGVEVDAWGVDVESVKENGRTYSVNMVR